MDILRRDILQIDIIDFGALFQIKSHARRSRNIGHRKLRMGIKLMFIIGFPDKLMAGGRLSSLCIDFLYGLNDLKQPGSSGNTVFFQGRCDREADCFLRLPRIRNNQIRRQRVQLPADTLHGGIKGL